MANDRSDRPASLIATAVQEVLDSGATAVIATVIETVPDGPAIGAKLLVCDSGEMIGGLGQADLDAVVARHSERFLQSRNETQASVVREIAPELGPFGDTKILFERVEAEPQLVIAGAGHVGASLARLAALIGYQVTLIDDRVEFVDPKLFSPAGSVRTVAADDWQSAVREAIGRGRGVAVAIVTRGHKQDEECLRATIAAKPDYVGMIGSKRRTNIVLEKLREEGFDEDDLRKVRAPVGLDIGAVSPEEVALSILSEIVAERRGGSGAPLSLWRRA
jgi:xanthine dehydrogenase accessory factor